QRAVLFERPARVVSDLPGVAVRVDEDPRVAAPEGLAGLAADGRTGLAGLLDHLVDLVGGPSVVGERDSAPAAAVRDGAVLGQLCSIPEPDDHAAGLEEDDVVALLRACLPAESLVELAGACEVRDTERDESEPLFHFVLLSVAGCRSYPALAPPP